MWNVRSGYTAHPDVLWLLWTWHSHFLRQRGSAGARTSRKTRGSGWAGQPPARTRFSRWTLGERACVLRKSTGFSNDRKVFYVFPFFDAFSSPVFKVKAGSHTTKASLHHYTNTTLSQLWSFTTLLKYWSSYFGATKFWNGLWSGAESIS